MHRFALLAGLLLILGSCSDGPAQGPGEAAATTILSAAPSSATTSAGDESSLSSAAIDPPPGQNDQAPATSMPEPTVPGAGEAADPSRPGDDGATPDDPREDPAPSELPETVSTTAPAGVTGEVPATLLAVVLQDFSARTGLAANQATVAIAESVIWPDGSLGCPAPGEIYEQAPVAGYRVLLEAAGSSYDYHLAATGHFVLCNPLQTP